MRARGNDEMLRGSARGERQYVSLRAIARLAAIWGLLRLRRKWEHAHRGSKKLWWHSIGSWIARELADANH